MGRYRAAGARRAEARAGTSLRSKDFIFGRVVVGRNSGMVNSKSHATPCTARLRCPEARMRHACPCDARRRRGARPRGARRRAMLGIFHVMTCVVCAASSSARDDGFRDDGDSPARAPHAPTAGHRTYTDIHTHTRHRTQDPERDTKPTPPPSPHYCVACALLYSGYPHVRPQSYLLPAPNVHCLCPQERAQSRTTANPLACAGRRGHPHHSASCEIVHHR